MRRVPYMSYKAPFLYQSCTKIHYDTYWSHEVFLDTEKIKSLRFKTKNPPEQSLRRISFGSPNRTRTCI